MKKIRMQFKRGKSLRFLSHKDQHRLFYRALRRAEFPLSYSQGYNPHVIMSFANALSVGMTSECEYVDVGLNIDDTSNLSANGLKKRLDKTLPKGLTITEAEFIPYDSKSLTKSILAAEYEIRCHGLKVYDFEEFKTFLNKFLAQDEIIAEKYSKKKHGYVKTNIKESIDSISVWEDKRDVIFSLKILPNNGALINPEIVVRTFLESVSYYDKSLNLETLRKRLFIENEDKEISR